MDRLQSASHVLANNISILESALREAKRRQVVLDAQKPSQDHRDQIMFESGVEDAIQELQFHRNQIELIIGRLDRTTTTISNLISLRSSYNMERMTERSILEAKAVRIIALVTLLFLPPTFTSGFLDMDSLDISRSEGGHLIIDARPEFLFFLALTIPLMIVTVGGWLLWDWLSTRRRARLEEPSLHMHLSDEHVPASL
ncbi:uncharacterized protein MYCFIDRAFT_183745 [Pseudocercospora fijiensis CIRAD86]|uniref:Uncharacterized protein n=1 Tax=Pseudocercospora fijiensis (strain CIRAD86) TaxID=383855 RepID=M3A4K1_PSEFD|nr:uncharacterized protein MYCFIDRAFT_183745 [Pseudocercospora fijiensis CIRAD86]EME79536.1 hypothetical protein MYCFIDRAFT_183745 [Pseudocercospora fijiensis CIRAD86]